MTRSSCKEVTIEFPIESYWLGSIMGNRDYRRNFNDLMNFLLDEYLLNTCHRCVFDKEHLLDSKGLTIIKHWLDANWYLGRFLKYNKFFAWILNLIERINEVPFNKLSALLWKQIKPYEHTNNYDFIKNYFMFGDKETFKRFEENFSIK